MNPILFEIQAERERQGRTGYPPKWDDSYSADVLATIAAGVACGEDGHALREAVDESIEDDINYIINHSSGRREQLIIAASLLFAAIERIEWKKDA